MWAIRYVLYAVSTALLLQSLVMAAVAGWVTEVGSESGPVEVAQLMLLIGSVLLYVRASGRRTACAEAFRLAAYAAALGLIRELDAFLDHSFYKGAYKVPAAVVGAFALTRAWRNRAAAREAITRWIPTPSFWFAALGGFIVLVYAQVVGQKELWQAIMGAGYARPVKDAVEELYELLGYALIFLSSIEAYSMARGEAATASVRAKLGVTTTESGSS